MTLVAVPDLLLYLGPIVTGSNNVVLDAVGEKAALIFQPPKAGSIDRVGFRVGTVTTGDTVDVRLETVGTDGFPTGTLWGTTTNGSKAVAAANTYYETALTASATVDTDDFVAAVVVQGSVPGNFNVLVANNLLQAPPYGASFLSAAWSFAPAAAPIMWFRYTDGSYAYVPGVLPGQVATVALSSTTTPDEVGMKITVPIACKVKGLWFYSGDATTPDLTAKLYDLSDTVLESVAVDGDFYSGAVGTAKVHRFMFDTEVSLTAGAGVRAALAFTTTTTINTARSASLFSTSVATAYPHGGAAVGTQRTDAGAWTDTTDQFYPVGLILSALDDGASSGGARSFGYVG